MEKEKKHWYDKYYKIILILPIVLLLLSLFYLYNFQQEHDDIILKDVTLTGGTTISVFDKNIQLSDLQSKLSGEFPDLSIRVLSDFRTGEERGFILETQSSIEEIRPALESVLGYELTQENSSIEFSGAAISKGFYQQLRFAILIAFIFMAIVVFILFRTFIPSIAVILAAFSDIIMTITVVDLLGIPLSTAGIVAFLMLIGYSVDTDILLTSRMLKSKEGNTNERLFSAFITGITMTLTSITAMAVALVIVYNSSEVLRQIFTILLIGLCFDLLNTWTANASILKLYVERKESS